MKWRLFVVTACILFVFGSAAEAYAGQGTETFTASGAVLFAQDNEEEEDEDLIEGLDTDEISNCVIGREYDVHIIGGQNHHLDCKFTLQERSHVRFNLKDCGFHKFPEKGNRDKPCDVNMEVFSKGWDLICTDFPTAKGSKQKGFSFDFSWDLRPGSYTLRISMPKLTDWYTALGVLTITKEPVYNIDRTSIKSLTCPSAGSAKVVVEAVADALVYEYQFSNDPDFSRMKTRKIPSTSATIKGLKKGAYHYVRVRAYTVYSDGEKVYGEWSRARAVYVKKSSNVVTIDTSSAAFKHKALKKRAETFYIYADDNINAKLRYKIVSVPAKAKKYFKLNKSTGKMTVKKGLKQGKYKLKVKVSAAATASYYGASATKTITVKVK